MQFDFTTVMDRAGKDAMAIDAIGSGRGYAPAAPDPGFDVIPMWVADMNFATAPCITRALQARIEHPAFGYFAPCDEYYDAIRWWHAQRKGVTDILPEHIGYENGVLGGLVSALAACCEPGGKVLVHSPTYIGFTAAIGNAGYTIVHSPLVQDAAGTWRMDYADMDAKLAEHGIRAAVFCSPHNPCGRVWERAEVARAMEVYERHGCTVIADEIWSDLVMPGHAHVPTQGVSEFAHANTVALYAPSKTFNLAGLVGSYHVIYDGGLRSRVRKAASKPHYNDMNVLSMHALIGAYCAEGAAWVDELVGVLDANLAFACSYIERHFEGVSAFRPQGTYMLFLDCSGWCAAHGCGIDELLEAGWRVGVAWQDGRIFGGKSHIRMNLALPLSRVKEAFARLDEFVF